MCSALRDELVALTCDLVRFPSIAERPDQLAAVMGYIDAYLAKIPNIVVERSTVGEKPALVVTLRETRHPALMLNAHLDVVAARPEQYAPELRDGRIYGRASQDMKGSAAVLLRLIKDLAALDSPPDVGFQFVSDEEIGGMLGTNRLLDEGWGCDFFIALEPTDLSICYAHKGSMWVDLFLPGVPSHGSRPWEGHNPIHDLASGLAAVEQRFPTAREEIYRTTVTPTCINTDAGSRNRLPSGVSITFDIRFVPEDQPATLVAALRECFPTAQLISDQHSVGLHTEPESPMVRKLAALAEGRTSQATRFYREHFATDARFYSAKGIPAVCFGPIGAGLHSDEEWVDIDSLVTLYEVMADLTRG